MLMVAVNCPWASACRAAPTAFTPLEKEMFTGPLADPFWSEVQSNVSPAFKLLCPHVQEGFAGHTTARMLFGPARFTAPPRPSFEVTPNEAPRVVPSGPSCAQLNASTRLPLPMPPTVSAIAEEASKSSPQSATEQKDFNISQPSRIRHQVRALDEVPLVIAIRHP